MLDNSIQNRRPLQGNSFELGNCSSMVFCSKQGHAITCDRPQVMASLQLCAARIFANWEVLTMGTVWQCYKTTNTHGYGLPVSVQITNRGLPLFTVAALVLKCWTVRPRIVTCYRVTGSMFVTVLQCCSVDSTETLLHDMCHPTGDGVQTVMACPYLCQWQRNKVPTMGNVLNAILHQLLTGPRL